jgi:hypothetical protein
MTREHVWDIGVVCGPLLSSQEAPKVRAAAILLFTALADTDADATTSTLDLLFPTSSTNASNTTTTNTANTNHININSATTATITSDTTTATTAITAKVATTPIPHGFWAGPRCLHLGEVCYTLLSHSYLMHLHILYSQQRYSAHPLLYST